MKRLLLVGGGHAHIEVLRRFGFAPLHGVEVSLVTPQPRTAYTGMLPGCIAGHYTPAECHVDVEALTAFAQATLISERASGIDLAGRTLHCLSGRAVPFDWLSLDIGSTPALGQIRNAASTGVPVKPFGALLIALQQLLAEARQQALHIVVVGGGAGGVELCLSLQHRFARELPHHACRFALVTQSKRLLPDHNERVGDKLERVLTERGIEVHRGCQVSGVEPGRLELANRRWLTADRVIWATGAAAASWPSDSGLRSDAHGFVLVDEFLRCPDHPYVFAAGDLATQPGRARPKSGVQAVRQGPVLAENLRRAMQDRPLRRFVPQRTTLALIGTGDASAVASWGSLALEGSWVWRWKDRIDRRFMARYRGLPASG